MKLIDLIRAALKIRPRSPGSKLKADSSKLKAQSSKLISDEAASALLIQLWTRGRRLSERTGGEVHLRAVSMATTGEIYAVLHHGDRDAAIVDVCQAWASNPELSFTWSDAVAFAGAKEEQ